MCHRMNPIITKLSHLFLLTDRVKTLLVLKVNRATMIISTNWLKTLLIGKAYRFPSNLSYKMMPMRSDHLVKNRAHLRKELKMKTMKMTSINQSTTLTKVWNRVDTIKNLILIHCFMLSLKSIMKYMLNRTVSSNQKWMYLLN